MLRTVTRSTKVLFRNGTPSARNSGKAAAFSVMVGRLQVSSGPAAPVAPTNRPWPEGRRHAA